MPDDVVERISKTIKELDHLSRKPETTIDDVIRIRGKIEGLRLARYYISDAYTTGSRWEG